MPSGFDVLHPGGMFENSPAFERWDYRRVALSPVGTAEARPIQPSLWDLSRTTPAPSVETLGYSQLSLRDKDKACATRARDASLTV